MHGPRVVVAMLVALSVAVWSAGQPTRQAISAAAGVTSRSTPHLTFTATISPVVIVPGARISIAVDVVPKKGMHVYAPGTQYRPVVIRLKGDPSLRVRNSVYPTPTVYRFKPLNEDVLVYDGPFRLVVDAIVGDALALRAQLGGRSQMTVKGTLDYQACDDRMCYLPASVPFQWTVRVAGE